LGLSSGSVRLTAGTNRRLRVFAVTQIAASFVLLAGAGMLLTALIALQAGAHRVQHAQRAGGARAGRRTTARPQEIARSTGGLRRISELPGVERVAVGTAVPWRDAGVFGPGFQFTSRATPRPMAKRIRARGSAPSRPGSSRRSACRSSPAATSRRRPRDGERS
jgi:putative ABC transport system permease protein